MKHRLAHAIDPAVQALLLRRAEHLATPETVEEVEHELLPVASFLVGENEYAIPLALLRMAIPIKAVAPVPLAAPQIIGVLRFGGEIITAFSLASLLGVRGWNVDPAVLLVLDTADELIAFDCEVIPQERTISAGAAKDALAHDPGPVVEVITSLSRSVFLIDVDRLLKRWKAKKP